MTLKLSAESLGISLASTSISTTSTTVTLATGTGLRFDTAGFREGDKIKSINSIPTKTYDEFVNYSWFFNKQERTVEVERNGKVIDLNLLDYFDSEEDFHLEYAIKQNDYDKDAAKFGFNFVYNSDIIQEYLSSTTSEGLVINNVMTGPAFYAGLMKNDIIEIILDHNFNK